MKTTLKNEFQCTSCDWEIGTDEPCEPEDINCVFCGSDMKRKEVSDESIIFV